MNRLSTIYLAIIRFFTWSSESESPKVSNLTINQGTKQLAQDIEEVHLFNAPANRFLSFDKNLLDKTLTQWQFGDWESLAKLERDTLQYHPDRAKLALLTAAGHLQQGDSQAARQFTRLAQDWGASKKLISQILISGAHNSLGRAAAVTGQAQLALQHFQWAIQVGAANSEVRLLTDARVNQQYCQLGLATGLSATLPKSQEQMLSFKSEVQENNLKFKLSEICKQEESPTNDSNPFYEGITSYAQNFEDVMLWRALHHVKNGFYIDVGANHPIDDSVSKAFYEKGWRGIHVEPLSHFVELLKKDRADELVLQAALTDTHISDSCSFYEVLAAPGLSTGDLTIAKRHQEKGFEFRETKVPSLTLADVISQAEERDVHWLKIDVEGMECKVLKGWGISSLRPWIVVIESTLPNTQVETHQEWEYLLTSRGYRWVYFDGANRFYLAAEHSNLARFFRTGPNAFDGFTLSGRGGPYCWRLNDQLVLQKDEINHLKQQVETLSGEK
jgi:FkbM family methyltransferase